MVKKLMKGRSFLPDRAALERWFQNEHTAGRLRLVLVIVLLALFTLQVHLLFTRSELGGASLRYAVIPLLLLGAALITGARYVQNIYELEQLSPALQYLAASLFSLRYPVLVVADGKLKLHPKEVNLLDEIGGPGWMVIRPGNAVVFEHPKRELQVRGAGTHFISRFETIKEIVNLEEQHDVIERISALSKDGIEVAVHEVRFRYRVQAFQQVVKETSRSLDNPYPFCDEAIIQMVYNRAVLPDGVQTWNESIRELLAKTIVDYISEHSVDEIIWPSYTQGDPRGAIYRRLNSTEVQQRLAEQGTELLWFDIGHFEAPDPQVAEQKMSVWQQRWAGNTNVARSFNNAQRQVYLDLGRAESQAEILMTVVHALDDLELRDDSLPEIQQAVVQRAGQILDTLREA